MLNELQHSYYTHAEGMIIFQVPRKISFLYHSITISINTLDKVTTVAIYMVLQ